MILFTKRIRIWILNTWTIAIPTFELLLIDSQYLRLKFFTNMPLLNYKILLIKEIKFLFVEHVFHQGMNYIHELIYLYPNY